MNLAEAQAAGNAGIQSAYQHSLFENPEWDVSAKSFLRWYCETHAEVFIEDATRMYSGLGYAEPAESRAWGHVVRFAKRQKWISDVPHGTKRRTQGHGSFGPTWASLIFRGVA